MKNLLYHSKVFLSRNASTILTCIGGVGVIATSVMAVKATPKALTLLDEAAMEKGESLTRLETVQVAARAYIPTVITGAATIACIFGANALNKKQQAALMSAYALLGSSYNEYKRKVKELYGDDADATVVQSIAKDKYADEDISLDGEKQLFYDEFSGRYFESTIEAVLRAEYDVNRKISLRGGTSINEFYETLNIPTVDFGYQLGWTRSGLMDSNLHSWLDFYHEKVVMDDGLECYIITIAHKPTYDYPYY